MRQARWTLAPGPAPGRELAQGDGGMRADRAASTGLLVCRGNRGTGHLFQRSPGDRLPGYVSRQRLHPRNRWEEASKQEGLGTQQTCPVSLGKAEPTFRKWGHRGPVSLAASCWRWGKAREGRESLASREFMPRAKVGAEQGQKTGPEATSRR